MDDNGVRVASVEAVLQSEIGISSAKMMKIQYLPEYVKNKVADTSALTTHSETTRQDEVISGPNALISLTKISTRTPREEIKKLLLEDPGREEHLRRHDFYTVVFITRIQMEDPSTTRFINATIQFVFPADVKILEYSPKERGIIMKIIRAGGTGIFISSGLDLTAVPSRGTGFTDVNPENRFEFRAGTDTKITGTYSKKSGFYLAIPPGELFEYMAMLKNEHEVYGEVYPPMPSFELESTGKENLAVFSLIVQTPRDVLPEVHVHVDSKVKGTIWGVILLKSRVIFSKT